MARHYSCFSGACAINLQCMAGLRVGAKEQLYPSKNSAKAAAGQRVKAQHAQRAHQQYLPPALA